MAFKVSYTKYPNCPAASFWSFLETAGPILLGLIALFGALGISLALDLKPIWSVLTFIGCFALAGVGIYFLSKLIKVMIRRALNKTWNRLIQEAYDKEMAKMPPEQAEELKKTDHAYACFNCSLVAGFPYKYKGRCPKCQGLMFFTGANIPRWKAMSDEERTRVTNLMNSYRA